MDLVSFDQRFSSEVAEAWDQWLGVEGSGSGSQSGGQPLEPLPSFSIEKIEEWRRLPSEPLPVNLAEVREGRMELWHGKIYAKFDYMKNMNCCYIARCLPTTLHQ